jgi:hypothetical protein
MCLTLRNAVAVLDHHDGRPPAHGYTRTRHHDADPDDPRRDRPGEQEEPGRRDARADDEVDSTQRAVVAAVTTPSTAANNPVSMGIGATTRSWAELVPTTSTGVPARTASSAARVTMSASDSPAATSWSIGMAATLCRAGPQIDYLMTRDYPAFPANADKVCGDAGQGDTCYSDQYDTRSECEAGA